MIETERWMSRALSLAMEGRWGVSPNPMVGAVVVKNGRLVGEGFHRRCGEAHAEVNALERAGTEARGATLYVTLEPCSHHGRTPPCVEAVIQAGLTEVVVAHRDPNPVVAGRGLSQLREAGIELKEGILRDQALALNWRYLIPKIHGRSAITLKWAMSLDGKIATHTGQSQWISSREGRQWALELRETHDAILVGSGTLLADNPRLNRRMERSPGSITRVVMDRRLRISPKANIFQEEGPVIVYTEANDPLHQELLNGAGATIVNLDEVTPQAVSRDLLERGLQSLLVEGGGEIHQAFFAEGCFDRVAVNLAPLIIGGRGAPGPVGGLGVNTIQEAYGLDNGQIVPMGKDFVVKGMREGCLQELFSSVEKL